MLVPYVVDGTIGVLLQLVDTEDSISVGVKSGDVLVDTKDLTESLEAEYRFSEGWINRFSKVRHDKTHEQADAEFPHKLRWDSDDRN